MCDDPKEPQDPPKLIPLDGGNNPSITAEAIRTLTANHPHVLDYLKLLAVQKYVYFTELKEQGFNDSQALHLTIASPF